MGELKLKRVHLYEVKNLLFVARTLNRCGKDMAKKYDLHHWDNIMIKSCIIVLLCMFKNQIYLVLDNNNPVATFQVKKLEDTLFFEKLAVDPEISGKGYGSNCMKLIERQAKKMECHKIRMEVYDKSKHAIEFYEHKGYVKVGETGTLKYTDLIMEKIVKL